MRSKRHDGDFFVGYLATPPALRRLLLSIAAAMLVTALLTAGVIASRQLDPGDGQWNSHPDQLSGAVFTWPYPMLQPADGSGMPLLVCAGKIAATLPAGISGGQSVRAHGTVLQRGNLRMLELQSVELLGSRIAPP